MSLLRMKFRLTCRRDVDYIRDLCSLYRKETTAVVVNLSRPSWAFYVHEEKAKDFPLPSQEVLLQKCLQNNVRSANLEREYFSKLWENLRLRYSIAAIKHCCCFDC